MLTILHVDDNSDDVLLVSSALKKAKLPVRIETAQDARQAIRYLGGCVTKEGGRIPDLLLLDLALPGMNGIEVLAYVNGHSQLCGLKTYVVSACADPAVRAVAETMGATFFTKTPGFRDLVRSVARLCGSGINGESGSQGRS